MPRTTTPRDYPHVQKPFLHQEKVFMHSRDMDNYALLHEQGTGKSKVLIDTAAWNYMNGRINAMIIIAPNGVHVGWVKEQLPEHMPKHISYRAAWWRASPKAAERDALESIFDPEYQGLRVITMNAEALSLPKSKAREYLNKMVLCFNCIIAVDESQRFKKPSAKRVRYLRTITPKCVMRRLASGTSMTVGPLDLYAQYALLDERILGYSTYTSFKADFGVWERRKVNNSRGFYDECVEYKNLDKLAALIDPYTDRVLKKDCLDLPKKLFKTVYIELTPQQRKAYTEIAKHDAAILREEMQQYTTAPLPAFANFEEELLYYLTDPNVPVVVAKHAAARVQKQRQISSGFMMDTDKTVRTIPGGNPKLAALLDLLEDYPGKIIIWAWYRHEIELLTKTLKEKYGDNKVVNYYGGTSADDKVAAVESFKHGEADYFVGQPISAGTGQTFTVSSVSFYFSRVPYEARYQSEDRTHRISQTVSPLYIDLIAQNTIEEKDAQRLRNQQNTMDEVYNKLTAC